MTNKIDIATMVQSIIMEEVNNLGVRAVVRKKIEEVGELNKDEIRQLVKETVDSYVRSAEIDKLIHDVVDTTVSSIVSRRVEAVVEKYLSGTFSCYEPSRQLQELILNDLKQQFYSKHKLKVVDTMRED